MSYDSGTAETKKALFMLALCWMYNSVSVVFKVLLPHDPGRYAIDSLLEGIAMSQDTSILIVDHSASIRMAVRETLENEGYEVTEAENGKVALWLTQGRQFDLVITDINMPIMGGVELIKELRNIREYHLTPILALTTESSQEAKDRVKAESAIGWITKPFLPGKLMEALNKLGIRA